MSRHDCQATLRNQRSLSATGMMPKLKDLKQDSIISTTLPQQRLLDGPDTSTLVQQSASSRPRRRHVNAYEVPQDVELVLLTLLRNQASLAGNPSM